MASNADSYTNTVYYSCLPNVALKSTKYRDMYLQKHANNYADLNADRLIEECYVLKCNWEVVDQIDYNEHCEKLHGVKPLELKQEQNIKVDSKVPFKLEPAMNIEQFGPDDHYAILGTWFTKGVACEVLTKSINRASTDVNEVRSKELLNEIITVTAKSFNSVFQIKLWEEVGDISYGFRAKWSQIEKAFFAALGSDQVIKRYNKCFDEGPSTHGGRPMEQIISDV